MSQWRERNFCPELKAGNVYNERSEKQFNNNFNNKKKSN